MDITINAPTGREIDEELRATGLEMIRKENNGRILEALNSISPLSEATLLDVGSAHGWFLNAAASRGARVFGIEPDEGVAARSQLPTTVRHGFFPYILSSDEVFDFITFNDVLEHIRDPADAIRASAQHLNPGGMLSINAPDSRGLGFAMSRAAARLGILAPYERLWQKDLPSPHVWYFNPEALKLMASRAGLELVYLQRLSTLSREGLWNRIHMERKPDIESRTQFFIVYLLSPVFNSSMCSDILHIVFRKPSEPMAWRINE